MSDRLEHIEKYVLGEMSEQEKISFESQMAEDETLKNAVDRMKIIQNALELSVENELRTKLEHLKKTQDQRSDDVISPLSIKSKKLFAPLAAAASIIILLSAGLLLFVGNKQSALHQFCQAEYVAYDYAQLRGGLDAARTLPMDMASGNYDQEEATIWFSEWVELHPEDYETRYVLSDILYKQKRYAEAKNHLEVIISSGSVLWSEKAEWNYILLSQGDQKDTLADSIFEKIITTSSHSYHQRAKELSELKNK